MKKNVSIWTTLIQLTRRIVCEMEMLNINYLNYDPLNFMFLN